MRIHPREETVNRAEIEIKSAMLDVMKKYSPNLTVPELLKILNKINGDIISSILKTVIRDERHPNDPDKFGGEE